MAYRDVAESLRAYRDRISADLATARNAAEEAAARAKNVAVLEKELAEAECFLSAAVQHRRALPLLDAVRVASRCTASWEEMVGDDRVRFCGECSKNVYNLSAMTREDAEALLHAKEERMCVRLYRREDGTVITADCPVGRKRVRRRAAAAVAAGSSVLAMTAALLTGSRDVPPAPTSQGPISQGEEAAFPAQGLADVGTPGTVAFPQAEGSPSSAPHRVTIGRLVRPSGALGAKKR